jgi:N-acetylmuramoyl-L-alanine amidase
MPRTLRFPVSLLLLALTLAAPPDTRASDPASWKRHEFTGKPLDGLRVALDIGHNRLKPGAPSARGKNELTFNTETARVIGRVLEKAGARVILVNADGLVATLPERAELAAKEKADCFISVHHDSVNDKYLKKWMHEGVERDYADDFRGYSVFTSEKNAEAEKSRELALRVGAALYDSGLRPTLHHAEPIEGENRPLLDERTGVYEFTDLVVLKTAPMPAILLECGVIIHRDEELLVQDPRYRDLIAHAVVRALAEVFPARKKKGLKGLFDPK